MPEAIIFGVACLVVGLSLFLLHRGTGRGKFDERQRLDVQNHIGDSRPLR